MKTTPEEQDIIRHSLGLDRNKVSYRNYYADEPDAPKLIALVKKGLMKKGSSIIGGLQYFHVTPEGRKSLRDKT